MTYELDGGSLKEEAVFKYWSSLNSSTRPRIKD